MTPANNLAYQNPGPKGTDLLIPPLQAEFSGPTPEIRRFRLPLEYAKNLELTFLLLELILGHLRASMSDHAALQTILALAIACLFAAARRSLRARLLRLACAGALFWAGFAGVRAAAPTAEAIAAAQDEAKTTTTGRKHKARMHLAFKGWVTEPVEHSPLHCLKFVMNDENHGGAKLALKANDLPLSDESRIAQGSFVEGKALVSPTVEHERMPKVLGYDAYLYRRGFAGYGRVKELSALRGAESASNWQSRFLQRLHLDFELSDSLVVLLAMTLGFKDLPGEQLLLLFRETGTTHLLVISGYQLGLLYFLLYRALCRIFRRFTPLVILLPVQLPAGCVALAFAVWYAFITGLSLPTARALVLVTVVAVGEMFSLQSKSVRNMLLAFLVILLIWPGAAFEPGCQLTFLAITGLLAGQSVIAFCSARKDEEWAAKILPAPPLPLRLLNMFYRSVVLCFSAWLFTFPVQLYWFHSFAPLAALFNMLVITGFSLCFTVCGGVSLLLYYAHPFIAAPLLEVNLRAGDVLLELLWLLRNTANEAGLGLLELGPVRAVRFACLAGFIDLVLLCLLIFLPLFMQQAATRAA